MWQSQVQRMNDHEYLMHVKLWAIGALIGIGQLLLGDADLRARRVIGRALVSGGIATAAGAVLVWIPDVAPGAMYGVAAALASLGTSGLERLVDRFVSGRL